MTFCSTTSIWGFFRVVSAPGELLGCRGHCHTFSCYWLVLHQITLKLPVHEDQ